MPRQGNGDYTLPAGNPVTSGEVIEASWANTTMPDIGTALTDSLSRTGSGGMLAPFLNDAGTVSAPGISWTVNPQSGWRFDNGGPFMFGVMNQSDIVRLSVDGVEVYGSLKVDGGDENNTAYSFTNDPDTGMYSSQPNEIAFATAGTRALAITDTNDLYGEGSFRPLPGTEALPAHSFSGGEGAGLYYDTVGSGFGPELGQSIGSVRQAWMDGGGFHTSGAINGVDSAEIVQARNLGGYPTGQPLDLQRLTQAEYDSDVTGGTEVTKFYMKGSVLYVIVD